MPEIVRQAELIMGVVVVSTGPRSLFFIFLLYFIFLLSLFLYTIFYGIERSLTYSKKNVVYKTW